MSNASTRNTSVPDNRTGMVKWLKAFGLALLSSGALMTGRGPEVLAASPATSDILSSDGAGEVANTVGLGRPMPLAGPDWTAAKPLPAGNPLWYVPLSVLRATQERPIFSASRRPPQRAVIAPPVDQVIAPVPQKVAVPELPPLTLIGAVVGGSDAIAVLLDRTNQKIVRLRQGESHAGWELSLVMGREVTLKQADRTETLALKGTDATPGAPVLLAPTVIGASMSGASSSAPYVVVRERASR
jgi:general secretion pathway protein N